MSCCAAVVWWVGESGADGAGWGQLPSPSVLWGTQATQAARSRPQGEKWAPISLQENKTDPSRSQDLHYPPPSILPPTAGGGRRLDSQTWSWVTFKPHLHSTACGMVSRQLSGSSVTLGLLMSCGHSRTFTVHGNSAADVTPPAPAGSSRLAYPTPVMPVKPPPAIHGNVPAGSPPKAGPCNPLKAAGLGKGTIPA